jgi:tetratricopeptide (TPR) repeat protein
MKDLHGLVTSSNNARSLESYARALNAFNSYLGDPLAIIDQALADDPGFVMGHVLRAHVCISLWEKSVLPQLRQSLDALRPLQTRASDRERRHFHALEQWAAGDWNGARETLDKLSAEFPRDLLALQSGHLSDFYHGDRDSLRGRIARALPAWSAGEPGHGYLLGMLAFGLEECGNYRVAEETGRRALDIEQNDSWAHHAVIHVMEMQARQGEAIAFAEGRRQYWAQADNGFRFHNWWHVGLFHLDQDEFKAALRVYDQGIRSETADVQLMKLDAAALLWRMHLRGLDVGNRWEELAKQYEHDAEGGFYAFNDVHAAMAFAATGRAAALSQRLAHLRLAATRVNSNAAMSHRVGLPIAKAIEAFGQGRYTDAVSLLLPVRHRAHEFGGSHAQRDIVQRTLIEAAIRAGEKSLAVALCNERVYLKPGCLFSLGWLGRASEVVRQANVA